MEKSHNTGIRLYTKKPSAYIVMKTNK